MEGQGGTAESQVPVAPRSGAAAVAIAVTISEHQQLGGDRRRRDGRRDRFARSQRSRGRARPGDNRSAVQQLLGLILGPSFPNVRAWAESFDAYAYPDRCHQTVAVPCP